MYRVIPLNGAERMSAPFIPELLIPAGDMEKLETAVLYGADAVYLGGGELNLRAGAGGFSPDELSLAVSKAREAGVKAYFTLNVFPREHMIPKAHAYLELLAEVRPDAVIVADPGMLAMVRRELPDMPIHISTQANTCNSESVRFWHGVGAKRVNVARELRSQELMQMLAACRRGMPEMELEIFVHGAQCMAVSGRCYLSAFLNDRPGNLGQCTHPCRYEYRPKSVLLEERTRPGEDLWEIQEYGVEQQPEDPMVSTDEFTFESEEDFTFHVESGQDGTNRDGTSLERVGIERGQATDGWTTFFAADDLCLLHYLEWFARMRVASVKVEGRTKSSAYLAQVTDAYRTALNDVRRGEFRPELYLPELVNAGSRPLTTGFFDPNRTGAISRPDLEEKRPVLARVVEPMEEGKWLVQTKARWETSSPLDILVPGLSRPRLGSGEYGVSDDQGNGRPVAHPGQYMVLECDHPAIKPGLFFRKA